MKRKILSILLCFGVSVSLLAGCGTKDVDATNDKVASSNSIEEEGDKSADSTKKEVNVTKNLEEQYMERLKAYQEILGSDYNYSDIMATVTLDEESLPLLWVYISGDSKITQLIGFEDGEAVILAERNEQIVPCRSTKIIFGVGNSSETSYLYDEEKKDFRIVDSEISSLCQGEEILSEKALEEAMDFLVPIMESKDYLLSLTFAVNESNHQIAYYEHEHQDIIQTTLEEIGVISGYRIGETMDISGYFLEEGYINNKVALKYFEQFPDANIDKDMMDRYGAGRAEVILDKYGSDMLCDLYWCYNGEGCAYRGIEVDNTKEDNLSSNGWEFINLKKGGYLTEDTDIRSLLRGLENNPVYTEEELCLYLASIKHNCEIVEKDLSEY